MRSHAPARGLLFFALASLLTLVTALSAPAAAETPTGAPLGSADQAIPEAEEGGVKLLPESPIIEVPEDAPPRPIVVKIEGRIQAIDDVMPGILTVKDIPIQVTSETRIRPPFLLPQVGDLVVIRATLEADETLEEPGIRYIAHYIRVVYDQDPGGKPFQFRGLITAFPPKPYIGQWAISGLTVMVLDDKVRSGPDPESGFFAQVEGFLQADGSVRAVTLHVLQPSEVLNRFDFGGPLRVMSAIPGDWIIGTVRGHVETTSQIEGNPALGLMTEISGHLGQDGRPIFDRIRVLSETRASVRIEGVIEAIQVDQDGFGHWLVDGETVEVDDQTFVDESRARAIPGMWADVTARIEGCYSYALRIRVERPE